LIASDGTPAAAVIAIEEYNELMTLRHALILQRRRDAMAKLRELHSNNNGVEFQTPERGERPIPKLEGKE
jgi:PHD/YefM family antitoxin component YafN of YafNO toxin-antitoxin module